MADLGGFDATTVEPSDEFQPLPAGEYRVIIEASDMEPTKAGTGKFLKLRLKLLDDPHKNRVLIDRLNLENPNAVAVKIAHAELSAICRAVDVLQPQDSNELHNLPLVVNVKCKNRADTGEIVNEVKGYQKKEAGAGQPQQVQTDTPPWRR